MEDKTLYVVGIGPGKPQQMTDEVKLILESCDILAGYKTYVDLIRENHPDKEIIETGMKSEVERCRMALSRAVAGKRVALISSGDAGIYGMAGLAIELSVDYPGVNIKVIPGISAAISGAAILGAPLMNDFCVISLSDMLTPWPVIENRLKMAALGDFCIAIYNPKSKGRPEHLKRACEILLTVIPKDRICGYVKNIGRDGETCTILSLESLSEAPVDMFTTVFIGNSSTVNINGKMVTPRGYTLA